MPNIKKILLLLALLIVLFIANILYSTGFFRNIENSFEGEIIEKIALTGAEDMQVSLSDSFVIISATNRFHPTEKKKQVDGLYLMDLKNENYIPKLLTTDLSIPFAPHGISMYKKDSSYKVMAVNHKNQGHSIEVFNLTNDVLTFEKTLTDPSMVQPNDLVMIDENRFYFTNDHGYTEGVGKFVEEYVGLSVSNVIYFDGKNYRKIADGIAYANGINFDADRNLLYVASSRGFSVLVYSRSESGALQFIEDIPCATGVDNIDIDNKGNLWIGAHPNLLTFSSYSKGKNKWSPSEIIKIKYRSKSEYFIEKIYEEDGRILSGASIAVSFGNLIFAGSVSDNKFLILKE